MSQNPSTHQPRNTNAFYAQAALSFAIALITMIWSIFYLPVDIWIRGFLGIGTLWLTTSAFTLAKCVRDAQEDQSENAPRPGARRAPRADPRASRSPTAPLS